MNADEPAGDPGPGLPAPELLGAAHRRQIAEDLIEGFARLYPRSVSWSEADRAGYTQRVAAGMAAVLDAAATSAGLDTVLAADLAAASAAAARAGVPLPRLVALVCRCRDLVAGGAAQWAEGRQMPADWAGAGQMPALASVRLRMEPVADQAIEAAAAGYATAAAERYEAAAARYEQLAAHSASGVYEADLDGRIVFANERLAVMVGRTREELGGAALGALLAAVGPGDLGLLLSEGGGGGAGTSGLRVMARRPGGTRRILSVHSSALRVGGRLVGFQGIVQDETEKQNFENERRDLGTLVMREMRAPLAAIVGLGATMESHGGELGLEQMQRIGQSVRLQAERISRLAEDLHVSAELDAGALHLTLRPVGLAGLVHTALASVRRGVAVGVAVAEGLEVMADPRRLEQVVANLVDNAVAYGAPPIEVAASQRENEVVVAVVDHGSGVAAEALEPLLYGAPPFRGRGLLLVRALTEAMGGRVWYEGGERECRFLLALPVPPPAG